MNLQLQNKAALISGSTKGIGFSIARQLAAEGARVIINGRSDHSVDTALQEIRQAVSTANIDGFTGDLATAKATEEPATNFPDGQLAPRDWKNLWRN